MKLLFASTIGVGVLIVLVVSAGYMLPPTRAGRAERIIGAPQSSVMAAIVDVERQVEWRSDVRQIELDGEAWIETTSRGERIRFAWTERSTSRLGLRFESNRGYFGEWKAELSPEPGGTRLSVEEQATIASPIGRLIARILFDPVAFSRRYLDALAAHVEDKS